MAFVDDESRDISILGENATSDGHTHCELACDLACDHYQCMRISAYINFTGFVRRMRRWASFIANRRRLSNEEKFPCRRITRSTHKACSVGRQPKTSQNVPTIVFQMVMPMTLSARASAMRHYFALTKLPDAATLLLPSTNHQLQDSYTATEPIQGGNTTSDGHTHCELACDLALRCDTTLH